LNKLLLETDAKSMRMAGGRKVAKNKLLNTQDVARGKRKRWKAWSVNAERDNTIIIMTFQILTAVLLYLNHLGCCPMSTNRYCL